MITQRVLGAGEKSINHRIPARIGGDTDIFKRELSNSISLTFWFSQPTKIKHLSSKTNLAISRVKIKQWKRMCFETRKYYM